MPTSFFDIHDGNVFVQDLDGFDFASLKEASAQAARPLVDLAKDRLSEDDQRQFTATVQRWRWGGGRHNDLVGYQRADLPELSLLRPKQTFGRRDRRPERQVSGTPR